MKWQNIQKNGYPKKGTRVLTYSPIYEEQDVYAFRLLDAQFVRTCIDVTFWAYLEKPGSE